MKKAILTCAIFGALFLTASPASAKGIIIYSNGEKIELFKKLPSEAVIDDTHVNLGVKYDQFAIFWIPMWNYGETKYVLINDEKDTYWDLDTETAELLKTEFNVDIPQKPTIGFWNRIGGKIIWGIVILAAIAGWWFSRKDDDEAEIPNQA
jgi:hypothetical protein